MIEATSRATAWAALSRRCVGIAAAAAMVEVLLAVVSPIDGRISKALIARGNLITTTSLLIMIVFDTPIYGRSMPTSRPTFDTRRLGAARKAQFLWASSRKRASRTVHAFAFSMTLLIRKAVDADTVLLASAAAWARRIVQGDGMRRQMIFVGRRGGFPVHVCVADSSVYPNDPCVETTDGYPEN
jgi:hypothetical protein